jgi:hypothetical protein
LCHCLSVNSRPTMYSRFCIKYSSMKKMYPNKTPALTQPQ